jgi:hypothetical protein
MRPKRVYRYGCEYEYAAERRRHLLVRRSVVLGERRLAASRGLAGKRQHSSSSSSRINNRDRDDDRAAAGHGAAVDRVGCNQIYTRSVLRLAWPAVICPGSSVDGVRAHLPLVRCGDETPFACSRAWDMPPCPHQAFISYSVPLTRLSHCSPQVHVSSWIKFGLISSHLPDVTPESCLVNATSRHTKSLQSSQTQIQGYRANFIDPFTAAREDGLRYRAASVRLGPQASAYYVF